MTAPEANPWRRLTRRVVYENPWLTIWHDDVVRPDDSPGIYGVVHLRHRAIGVLPIDADGRVLLVGQYRYTIDRYSWEMPEGGGDFEEEPLDEARRELEEETGYSAASWRELYRADLSNSVTDEEAIAFVATDLVAGEPRPEATEKLQLRWATLDEALAMIKSGEIRDMMTVAALYAFAVERSEP